ncbi:MAG: MFS transporter [Chloroflexota bacterium]|jgi:MFS transporter, DHA3 family, macrolide efflux protein
MKNDDHSLNRNMRPFFILWVGQAFSLLGSQLVQFALIWWLVQQTGSATVLAGASIVGLLPQVLLGPFAGVLVDRWNRKLTLLGADITVALATLALAILFWADMAQIWQVYAILFIRALGGTFHWPAMTASISLMVPQEQLTRIQGLNQILNGGLNIAAAPLGALLVTLVPIQNVLLIDLATALVGMTTVLIVHIPQPERKKEEQSSQSFTRVYWSDMREGLKYLLGWRGLLILTGMAMMLNMVLSPTTSFMPLLITDHFNGGPWHLGLVQSAFGVGILLGGLLLGVWGGFKRRVYTSLFGVAGIGAGILLVGIAPASLFPLAIAGMLLGGIMSSLANGPILAIFQANVEPGMQGRVLALVGSATAAMMPISLALAGPLADIIGVRVWFIFGGLISLAVAIAGFFIPSLVNIEQERDDFPEMVSEQPTEISGPTPLPPLVERSEASVG